MLIFLLQEERKVEKILFFPSSINEEVSGESRVIEHYTDREQTVERFLKELTLGPVSLHHSRILPRNTKINLVMLRDDTLYIDYSIEVIMNRDGIKLSFPEIEEILHRSLRFNFPYLNSIIISVDGQLPHYPASLPIL